MNTTGPMKGAGKNHGAHLSDPQGGFTLIELLVAMALLALVGVLIAEITTSIGRATRLSNQGVDAAGQARLAFDRIGMDLGGAVIRTDVDFAAAPTNSANANFLTFLSTIPSADPTNSSFTNRRISLVGYRIGTTTDSTNACLLRAGRPIGWNETGFMGILTNGITTNGTVTNTVPVEIAASGFSPSAADFDILAPAVIHSVLGFQLYPDNQPTPLADGSINTIARGQVVYSPPVRSNSTLVDPSRISALVVGLVVIDPERIKLLDATAFSQLTGAFSGRPAAGQLPVAKWMADTGNLANLPDTVPLPVRQSVRVLQRFFPIRPYGTPTP